MTKDSATGYHGGGIEAGAATGDAKMTMAGPIILAIPVLLAIVLGGQQLVGPRIGKYRITDTSIQFILFGNLPVWTSSFDDILEIRSISFSRMLIAPSLHLMNRPFAQYVLVRKRRGIFRTVVITPDDAGKFVKLVQQKTGHAV
jgi:hypothetical protein